MPLTRRSFIKIGSAAAGGLALSGGLMTNLYGLDRNRLTDPQTEGDRIIPTFCELCFWKCGLLAHVRDGRVTKLKGNPKHPLSRGRLCPRGAGGTGLLYDPDRLKTPLVRMRKRGEDVFEAVSWETALDRVAEGMQRVKEQHGPEALGLFQHGFGSSWFTHLVHAYGSPNIAAPSYAQCRGPREAGFQMTFGEGVGSPERIDMENADAIVLIGSHLGENMHNTQVQDFARAVERGATIVVVDPRFSTAAAKADYWLPIKPGTDIALLLAWIHVILDERLHDQPYVESFAFGLEQLRAHVADKTPEWAYPRTGIRPELIRASARAFAAAKPAVVVHPGRRVTWYGDDTQRTRAIAILAGLLGSWGRRGGYLAPEAMKIPKLDVPAYPEDHRPAADRPKDGAYPLAGTVLASGLCSATIPGYAVYDLKAWMVYGTNLITTLPDPAATIRAIEALDLLVAIDVLPAEICGWADVVLPEATYLERTDDLDAPAYKEPFVAIRQQVVPPLHESKPGWWIARELGMRLGLEASFPWTDADEVIRLRAEKAGLDFTELSATGVVLGPRKPVTFEEGVAPEFSTPSGRLELYSNQLAEAGFDPMPVFTPPEEAPPGFYRLLVGRSPVHTFGRTTNNPLLCEVADENEVWVAAGVARDHDLAHGERVLLVNQDGVEEGPIRVKVTERIRGDCVYMTHGFGHTARGMRRTLRRGASDAALMTRVKVDPVMGGTGIGVNFVTFKKAQGGARA